MNNRNRILYLYQILQKYTDSEHPLTTSELVQKLKELYDIDTERNTLGTDLRALIQCGFPIEKIRSTQNKYYFDEQIFNLPEIKILIDEISSSKFITAKKSQELISKLLLFSNIHEEEKLKRHITVTGRIKSENEKGYYIVDAVNEAIDTKRKIMFQYTEYDQHKNKILCHDGEYYLVSPYILLSDGDFYYLKGLNEKKHQVENFRLDRINQQPEILDEPATELSEPFNLTEYSKAAFRMFDTDKPEEVTLLCKNKTMNTLIDKFGMDVDTIPIDADSFMAKVTVYPSLTFYRWVFGWNGKIKILGPEPVRCKYQEMLKSAIE